jgi:hypothetical protein
MPPLPPAAPPRAEIAPATCVAASLHTTTLPPLPRSSASARITASLPT